MPCKTYKLFDPVSLKILCNTSSAEVFEPNSKHPQLFGNSPINYTTSQVSLPFMFKTTTEYGYIQCNDTIKDVFLKHVTNEYAKSNTEKMYSKLKNNYKTGSDSKPLTVVLFVIDSTSRKSLFRNLNKTVNFFNEEVVKDNSTFSEEFVLYDFLGSNAIRDFTRANMIPMLYGISLETAKMKEKKKSIDKEVDKHFYLKRQIERSVWYYFKKKGFMTMFMNDAVSDYLSEDLGREILVDHQVSNIWKIGKQFFGYDDMAEAHSCIGSSYAHNYSLDYLTEYLNDYKGLNKFAYVHVNTAHENTGMQLSISDRDYRNFFHKLLSSYTHKDENLFFIFMSDHGRYRKEYVTLEGYAEKALPFTIILSTKTLISSHNFHQTLSTNTKRLLSRYDIYKTLKNLAILPYTTITTTSLNYQEINTEFPSVSLLIEEIPKQRTCSDASIDENFCMSDKFSILNPSSNNSTILSFIQISISKINSILIKEISQYCNPLFFNDIKSLQLKKYVTKNEIPPLHYIIVISIKDSKSIFFIDATHSEAKFLKNDPELFKRFTKSKEKLERIGNNTYLSTINKIWSVTKLNIVDGDNVKKNFDIENDKGKCDEKVFYNYNYLWADGYEKCENVCGRYEMECTDPKYLHVFLEMWQGEFEKIDRVAGGSSLEVDDGRLFVGRVDMCSGIGDTIKKICYCVMVR
ncbi:hypothetical protein SteCoe_9804 [Stentor coeruleus]|uniref:Uncharacterized protein n=1 Tax=Stentor coeruleus TaxID=5963 RepID=A0A1R2CH30_9CILI|nr:hypothetical protein SteCoe_9804 [Stentor coeruleus]